MPCQDVLEALIDFTRCDATEEGCRVQTHCLYPSYESVAVYIVKVGQTFRVSDNSEAFSNAWAHGRDDRSMQRLFEDECRRFHIRFDNRAIVATTDSADWLSNTILTVANAAAGAASAAVAKRNAATEEVLSDRIGRSLEETFGAKAVGRDHEELGNSGGMRKFDYIVRGNSDSILLVNAVTSHGNSVSSKYVAFADTDLQRERKLAVFERELAADVKSLLGQVSTTLPYASLTRGAERALAYAL